MKKRRQGNKSPSPIEKEDKITTANYLASLDEQLSDEETNQGFGNWLRSSEGVSYLRLFVVANSLLMFITMSWPHMQNVTMIPLVAVGFRVMFMGGLIMWYSTSVWQTVDTYFRDEFKKHIEKYPLYEKIQNNVDDSELKNLVKPDVAKTISNREKDQIKTQIEANSYSFKSNSKYEKKYFGLKIESDVETLENIKIPPEEKCDLTDGSRDKEKIDARLNPNFWSDEMDDEVCLYVTDDDMLQKSGED